MAKPLVFIHVFPTHERGHHVEGGADCWCEPIVQHQFHPHDPNLVINLCVHRREFIGTSIIVKDKHGTQRVEQRPPRRNHGPSQP